MLRRLCIGLYVVTAVVIYGVDLQPDWYFTGPNVAWRKETTQWHGDFNSHYASFAVDGNTITDFSKGSCSHTNGGKGAGWSVNLGQPYFIKGIRIYNRVIENNEGVSARLANFFVQGFHQRNGVPLYDDRTSSQKQYKKSKIEIAYFKIQAFQNISINLPAHDGFPDNGNSYLTLCEVEIFAVFCTDIDTRHNVSLERRNWLDTGNIYNNGKMYINVGSVIGFTCNSSAKLEGSQNITCLKNGSYSASTPYCRKQCNERPVIHDGKYLENETFYSGDKAEWICNTNYEPIDVPSITCNQNGEWNTKYPMCRHIVCPFPEINGSNIDILQFKNGSEYRNGSFEAGHTVYILCKKGYQQNFMNITCLNNSNWAPNTNLACTEITCKELTINHANLNYNTRPVHENWYKYNTTLIVQCENDYRLSQAINSLKCSSNGTWSNGIVYCESLSEISIAAIVGGTVGGAAAFVAIVAAAIYIFVCKRRTRPKPKLENTSNALSTDTCANQNTVIYSEIQGNETRSRTDTVDDTAYYSFTNPLKLPERGIKLEDLADFVLAADTANDKYSKEFEGFPEGMTKQHAAALKNRGKNRYRNLYAYDESRVVLDVLNQPKETDYINACYIHGFDVPRAYIASQGVTKENLDDFWRMIWQTKCGKIVMLTNIMEEGKVKCEQYWPDTGTEIYGSISVTATHTEVFSNFVIRTFSVSTNGEKKRIVVQFHFTAWPDQGVPKYCSALVHFHNKVNTTHSSLRGPVVVHCSAGIGRTGTYIALDYLTDQGRTLGVVDAPGCVETLRRQRVNMVQTKEQYIFVHQALVETLMLATSAITTSEFPNVYRDLKSIDPQKGKCKMDIEFEMIDNMSPVIDENQYTTAKSLKYRQKNRYSNILPVEDFMPSLFEPGFSKNGGYINGVFLPSYKESNALIITQTPLEDTQQDFWKMVFHQNVHTIVMMNHELEMTGNEVYWPLENAIEQGDFTIEHKSKDLQKGHIVLTMMLKFQNLEPRSVHLLQFGAWPGGSPLPESPNAILTALDLVQEWQRQTGNNPVLVHCMNGAEKSGLFCVLYALLERTKIEHDVAISQVIQEMRNRRQQIISNVGQFEYCHDVISEFLKHFETYGNFNEL